MSTSNFYNDAYFDLYVWDDEEADFNYSESCLDNALEYAQEKLKRNLFFFEINIEGGHYSGAQLRIRENIYCRDYGNPYERDSEGCRDQWGTCRSKTIKDYESEKKWINKKLLPCLADYLGMRKLYCLGVFSNGEAVYEYAKQ